MDEQPRVGRIRPDGSMEWRQPTPEEWRRMEWGHATPEEQQIVEERVRHLDVEQSPLEDLFALGHLYIEPCHREDKAEEMFQVILKRDPNHVPAKFSVAYIYYFGSGYGRILDLERAVPLLQSIIDRGRDSAGAAYLFLTYVLNSLQTLPPERERELLESSVVCEPDWFENRMLLAQAYEKLGRYGDALHQLQCAQANLLANREPDWNQIFPIFGPEITGLPCSGPHRVWSNKRLESDLERIGRAMSNGHC
jgi:tetratricopeptide (TPR) repeat protein